MMKISALSLGFPAWKLEDITQNLKSYGCDAVDFRGYLDTVDITLCPEFTTDLASTRQLLSERSLEVSGISSSIAICEADRGDENLAEAERTLALALSLEAPFIRVFGGGNPERCSRPELVRIGADMMGRILDLNHSDQVRWVVETHDHWIVSADMAELVSAIGDPACGVVWDIAHTARVGRESPEQTWENLGQWVVYTHIKDAAVEPQQPAAMGDGWCYTPLGQGSLPIKEALALLKAKGYDGYLAIEHEKRWQPKLPEPEEYLPEAATWLRTTWDEV